MPLPALKLTSCVVGLWLLAANATALTATAEPAAVPGSIDEMVLAHQPAPSVAVIERLLAMPAEQRQQLRIVALAPHIVELLYSIGAGDACTAALLTARLLGRDWQATLDLANRHGAFVASQPGATPPLPGEIWAKYELDK